MSGKGDTPRPGDSQRYREEYDRIFAPREEPVVRQQPAMHVHIDGDDVWIRCMQMEHMGGRM